MDVTQRQLVDEKVSLALNQSPEEHREHMEVLTPWEFGAQPVVSTSITSLQETGIAGSFEVSPTSCAADSLWACQCPSFSEEIDRYKEMEEKNAGWPWVGAPRKMATQAPFAVSEYNDGLFRTPRAIQHSALFNIHGGMEHPILSILFEYHSCASKFAATCQAAFHMAAAYVDHWDITRCNFNGCDEDPKRNPGYEKASAGKIVVVTPFRVRQWRGENYKCEMFGLQKMTHALDNFAGGFEILHLHRIPLLTTHLLALVVPEMRRLKVLGVYRCEMIHLGDTMKLLEIIRRDRGSDMTKKVALDFYPRFHEGPVWTQENIYYTGSYGVTWDNFVFDSRLAIWQLLSKILPQAKSQGVDLVGKDAAFKLWMDKSPCWRVDETMEAIQSNWKAERLAIQINYPITRGKRQKLSYGGKWCLDRYGCFHCQDHLLGIFFDYDEYMQHRFFSAPGVYTMVCLGCKLTQHLNSETDHNKIYKMDMVKKWLQNDDGTINENNLQQALRRTSKKRGVRTAGLYDQERKRQAKTRPGPERQDPFRKRWSYSPTICDREPEESFW